MNIDIFGNLTKNFSIRGNSVGLSNCGLSYYSPNRMVKKICLFIMFFFLFSTIVYAERFMVLTTPVDCEFMGNDIGKGGVMATNLRNYLDSKRIRYKDVNFQDDNVYYINEIVRRHTIRRGDIYFIAAYFSFTGNSKVGIIEFTSETQYTYWFYLFPGTL